MAYLEIVSVGCEPLVVRDGGGCGRGYFGILLPLLKQEKLSSCRWGGEGDGMAQYPSPFNYSTGLNFPSQERYGVNSVG